MYVVNYILVYLTIVWYVLNVILLVFYTCTQASLENRVD